ncbi:response regulator [Candidatus Woesearchaeota archaeon]|nr:response regulator [Candidatus Woesearchaeota archaeon]
MVNILVVDDEFDDLKKIKSVLERDGHNITAVTSGSRALEALAGPEFDVVIVDILMPSLCGYELLKILEQRKKYKTSVVFLSIMPGKEFMNSYSDVFIKKPFSTEALLSGIREALGKSKKAKVKSSAKRRESKSKASSKKRK